MCMWKHWGFLIVDAISRYWKTPCIEWNKSVTKNGTKNRSYWPKREVCVKHQKKKETRNERMWHRTLFRMMERKMKDTLGWELKKGKVTGKEIGKSTRVTKKHWKWKEEQIIENLKTIC